MNRRSFLKGLGLVGVAAATPKLIFDLGANKRIYAPVGPQIVGTNFMYLKAWDNFPAYSLAALSVNSMSAILANGMAGTEYMKVGVPVVPMKKGEWGYFQVGGFAEVTMCRWDRSNA